MRKLLYSFILLALVLQGLFFDVQPARAGALMSPPNGLGLVGYWSFNEGNGIQAGDYSGNKNQGTLAGSTLPAWTDGKRNKALNFDGSTSYVDVGNKASLEPVQFTISAWIKPRNVTSQQQIAGKYGNAPGGACAYGYRLETTTDSKVAISVDPVGCGNSNIVASVSTIGTGVWYHVVGTYDGTTATLYLNGNLENSGTRAAPGYYTNFYIGASYSDYSSAFQGWFNGFIDEVRVYNRVLSATEVAGLYQAGSTLMNAPSKQGLVGYWPMNEGSGTRAEDFSGDKNYGTLSGATLPTWVDGKHGKAVNFDGVNDSIVAGSSTSLDISDTFTFSTWVNINAIDNALIPRFVTKAADANNFYMAGVNNGGTGLWAWFRRGGTDYRVSSSNQIGTGNWAYMVVIYSSGTLKMYINGNDVTTAGGGPGSARSSTTLYFGSYQGGSYFFNGKMDHIRIYNRILSQPEIAALYQSGEVKINELPNKVTNGLVGYWSFNGADVSGTTAYDRSGQSNNGTITGTKVAIGKMGQGLSFDGVDDTVNVGKGTALNGLTNFTFSAWIKPNSFSNGCRSGIISRRPGLNFTVTGRNGNGCGEVNYQRLMVLESGSGLVTGTTIMQAGQWYYVVAVMQGTSISMYLNGVLDGSGTGSYTWDSLVDVTIGSIAGIGGYYFDGVIDEVRVYNRALTLAEIQQLYSQGK